MSGPAHEPNPDIVAFLGATQKAVELEYDYVLNAVGQETMLRDIDHKKMSRIAISLLLQADLETFREDLGHPNTASNEYTVMSASDKASLEYLHLLAGDLGAMSGYYLSLVNDRKIIVDHLTRTQDACLIIVSLEASLSPASIEVKKDRYIILNGRQTMKDTLDTEPEDIAVIDQFIQKLIALR